jgi:hypothetical protein
MGSSSSVSIGRARCHPQATASAADCAVKVPLNLSGTINTFSPMASQAPNSLPQSQSELRPWNFLDLWQLKEDLNYE